MSNEVWQYNTPTLVKYAVTLRIVKYYAQYFFIYCNTLVLPSPAVLLHILRYSNHFESKLCSMRLLLCLGIRNYQ
jgi:hypothetical protein